MHTPQGVLRPPRNGLLGGGRWTPRHSPVSVGWLQALQRPRSLHVEPTAALTATQYLAMSLTVVLNLLVVVFSVYTGKETNITVISRHVTEAVPTPRMRGHTKGRGSAQRPVCNQQDAY